MRHPKVIIVCGPTATGKSDLAVLLARRFKGEVVSADSRQVYRGLDVGSGKITRREMNGVPHHLIDVCDPKKTYNVERFKNDGRKAIEDILSRGDVPIICGGTGFYIDALAYDESFPAVPPDAKLRARLAKKSTKTLMKEIEKLDPRRAKELDPLNKVRIIRAIEIARVLGKVPKMKRTKAYETLWIGLTTDRKALREKIRARLQRRMKQGMVEEAKSLRKRGLSWKRFHELGLEYRFLALYLQGKISKESMLLELENRIVDFSKRQMTWFQRNKDIHWLRPDQSGKALSLAKRFLS
ncbi:MAG: tRNA (adenosine(37)-N6)-dimethylallyltransferase MiaA [Candidatus Taylorbacteria bacterium]|nr:tRNA (adenosine(37)-N6)-dimethylallyltransferase MiaA [Candidatus Taylorbacteria bacterium]